MIRVLVSTLLLAGFSSCIIHVDASDNPELGAALTVWREPGFRALADDLDDAGWDIEDIDRRHDYWKIEVRTHDGRQDADLNVKFGPGRDYTIEKLVIDAEYGADTHARVRLRELVDPETIEVEEIKIDTN